MQAIIIFNGIRFPHELVEKTIQWAKENSAGLHAIFLSGREHEEHYPFPSDLDEAQDATDKHDAEQSDFRVMDSQIKLLEDMAAAQHINCETEIMVNPALNDVLAKTGNADAIFVNAEEESGLMAVTKFEMKELVDRLPAGRVKA